MKKLKMVIVGTGRCGTGYISKVFTGMGVSCGHERIFGFINRKNILDESLVIKNMANANLVADSSWLAVPFLYPEFPLLSEETVVVHLVRNPIDVIRSFCKLGFFDKNNSYAKFAYSNLKQLDSTKNQLENAIRWYIGWNGLIEKRGNKFENFIFHRVEDDVKILLKKLNIEYKNREIFNNKKYNTVRLNTKIGINPDFSKIKSKSRLLNIIEKYGYTENI